MFSIQVDPELEKRFRRTIGELRGTHKGNLKNALDEAITLWLEVAEIKFNKIIKEAEEVRKDMEANRIELERFNKLKKVDFQDPGILELKDALESAKESQRKLDQSLKSLASQELKKKL